MTTQTEVKHTPTPWRLQKSETEPDHWTIYSSNPPHLDIADVRPWIPEGANGGNAEFIVRAVNAHDELVADIRSALGWVRTAKADNDAGKLLIAIERLERALAKAEGQS